jgi:hypothetical protein
MPRSIKRLDEIVMTTKRKAESLANRGDAFSRIRAPLWRIFDDCADEIAAIDERERRFRCSLELMTVCKDVGVMPSCHSSCIATLCSTLEDTLMGWPAEDDGDCATLRDMTLKLHSAVGRLGEGGGWGEDETAALMKNWLTDAPEEVRSEGTCARGSAHEAPCSGKCTASGSGALCAVGPGHADRVEWRRFVQDLEAGNRS